MHPILFTVPFPAGALRLAPALLVLAVVMAIIAFAGWRKRLTSVQWAGTAAAAGLAIAGVVLRGSTLQLGALPIYSYGAMLCLSLIVGWYLSLGLAGADRMPTEVMANCYFVTALAALAGARILYLVTNPAEFGSMQAVFAFRTGGLVAYGGFIGGLLGSWAFLRRHGLPLLPWADVVAPSLAAGVLLTRIGCYLFGCDYGRPLNTTAPTWLKSLGSFPRWQSGTMPIGSGSPAWLAHVEHRGLAPDAATSLPVHPTQLYESFIGLVLLVGTLYVRRRRRFTGEVFLSFVVGYGTLRFAVELLRDDAERGAYGPHLRLQTYVALVAIMIAAAVGYGPARSIERAWLRRVVQLGPALLVALLVVFRLRYPEYGRQYGQLQLSTSQWIGAGSAIAGSLVWPHLARRGVVSVAE